MKRGFKIIITSLFLASAYNANAEVSYTVTFVSDYVFEGVTQTMEDPALQGSIDYSNDIGFYAGAWASNVDFGGDAEGLELDLYFGYSAEVNSNLAFDIGFVDYVYLNDDNDGFDGYDYQEIYGSLTFQESTTLSAWLADDDEAFGGSSIRLKVAHSISLVDEYSLNISYHHWKTKWDMWGGKDNYGAYQIGLSKSFDEFDIELNYSDTNIDDWETAEEGVYFTIGKSF